MAQISETDVLERILMAGVGPKEGVLGLLDRESERFLPDEGPLLDYKRLLKIDPPNAAAELARDVLGFSNTDGGLLIVGVSDDKEIVGHEKVDFRALRDVLGHFIGTRVNLDIEECLVNTRGQTQRLIAIVVHRSSAAYPNQLRRDIEIRPGLVKKLKYVRGTLFFRRASETLAASPYDDIESKARELGFSGAAPRTRTSFLLQEDKPGLRLYAPINDRFFGREAEIADLIAKFDDPRGRGVSIAGFGVSARPSLAYA